ncbi:ABC transporter permease [Cohnella terricola]|uniref:ABC transporter permease n=1 Tax=Cohnella terricola TaxID=1289167 RepID=A0A559IV78_9BACL|nr:ABC-2 family transporter protein [Cohnella terricola]TVX91528.1 ABC transporter permease [Cohnella terricola]
MGEEINRWTAAGRKAAAVGKIAFRHQLAYKTDFAMRCFFLLFILFVFIQLWSTAYGGNFETVISGFTLKQIVWYLVFTEALTLAAPPLCARIEEEVKNGDVAIRLIRPQSYVGYHFSVFASEALTRFLVHLLVGSAITWPFVGPPAFGYGWFGLLALSAGALTITFLLLAIVGLCAFWVEETSGLYFVLQKLQFTIGGMLLPIDLMPEWLQRVCAWLPFQAALYFPARMAVHYDAALLAKHLAVQAAWIAVLAFAVGRIYRRGATKLHVNGG